MSEDKETISTDGASNGYAVGYGKPPTHTQFRAGRSGNPAGRRKGVRNLATDVRRTLRVPVKVKEGGRTRKISTQEGALMRLREKALQGDPRALDRLLELASRFNNDGGEIGPAQALAADDQAILDAYRRDVAGTAMQPITGESNGDQANLAANSHEKPE